MLISNVHKSVIVMIYLDTPFQEGFLKSSNKLDGRVLSGYKATQLRLVALYPDKTLPLVH